jgi:hypothetical protein
MTERFDLCDEHGRISGYVLRETSHHTTYFRPRARAPRSESPIAVATCLALGVIMLVATLAYLWTVAMTG